MVNNNKGVPEPPSTSEETLSMSEDVVLGTDSDTDEDENGLAGYEPLPLVPPEDGNHESSDSEEDSGIDSGNGQTFNDDNLPPINRIEHALVREVWSVPPPPAADIKMDSNKVDEVKQVIANVTLPPSSIPDWANAIPEEQWKEHLMNRLQEIQKNSN